ncbi:head-tail preconnector protein [Escherichia coli]|nr:head-tail preconnector protein [Escherichia coli]
MTGADRKNTWFIKSSDYRALSDTKEIVAENMVHLKFTRRLHQTRGTSMVVRCADADQCA